MFPTDPRQLEQQPVDAGASSPYFEVLVVEKMTEAQERALRKEVRSWRRPDDEFVYELVVVSSGDEALIAARLNVNLQAVVIRRRFSHQSTRDLSTLWRSSSTPRSPTSWPITSRPTSARRSSPRR